MNIPVMGPPLNLLYKHRQKMSQQQMNDVPQTIKRSAFERAIRRAVARSYKSEADSAAYAAAVADNLFMPDVRHGGLDRTR